MSRTGWDDELGEDPETGIDTDPPPHRGAIYGDASSPPKPMSAPELKPPIPCPFCGASQEILAARDNEAEWLYCVMCGATGPIAHWKPGPEAVAYPWATEAWNRRAETRGAAGSTGHREEARRDDIVRAIRGVVDLAVKCQRRKEREQEFDEKTKHWYAAEILADIGQRAIEAVLDVVDTPSTSPAEPVREEGEDVKGLIWRLDARALADRDALVEEAADALRSRLAREHDGGEAFDRGSRWHALAIRAGILRCVTNPTDSEFGARLLNLMVEVEKAIPARREHEGEQEPAIEWRVEFRRLGRGGPWRHEFTTPLETAAVEWVGAPSEVYERRVVPLYARPTPSTSTGEGRE